MMAKRTPLRSGNSGNIGPGVEELSKLGFLAIYTVGIVEDVNTRFGKSDAVDICFARIHADGTTGELDETRLFSTVLFDTLSAPSAPGSPGASSSRPEKDTGRSTRPKTAKITPSTGR